MDIAQEATVQSLDLGHGHILTYYPWTPNARLHPDHADLPQVERFSATVEHTRPDGKACISGVTFDGPVARQLVPLSGLWTVESWEPLTINPSLLCGGCGDHGWIREGRWVQA